MAGIGYNNRLDEGFPTMGSPERQMAWARDRASRGRYSPERSPGDVLPAIGFGIYDALKERGAFTPSAGPDVPFGGSQAARNVVVAEQQARQQKQANPATRQNPGIVYRNSMEEGKPYPVSQRATTPVSPPMRAHSSPERTSDGAVVYQPTQYDKSRSVPGAAGTSEQRDNHPGAANYGTYAKPTWFDVEGSNGKVRVGYWDVDGTRQTLVRHGTFPEKSQAQPQQPRGLHYVPGGWANDGYSFEGSAEDRARFFAPVSGPGRAPRSDNDTFLALQRQKAMQPVEQPLPERPEFPTDPKMGWHTKLAKYQADMDAYNRQMASRAGYQQAMDVEALRQMQRESPAEAARLERQLGLQERQLGLQERQAAQQAAYQQAQLDQQNMKTALDYQAGLPGRQVQEAQLGYQMAMAKARQDVIDAMNSGDQERIKKAESVWKLFSDNENKQDKKEKWSVQKITDGNGEDRYFRVEENSGATYPIDFNVPTQIDQDVVRDNSAFLDKMIRDYPDMASDLNRLRSGVGNPNFRNEIKAMIERANR